MYLRSSSVCSAFKSSKGFTLVELVLALGVAAFSLISIVGLIPVGLSSLRTSIELNVQASIMQRISGLASQSDFESLDALAQRTLYFDDQGTLITNQNDAIFEVRLDTPDVVDALASSEHWPFYSGNLKRMMVHIHYSNRPASASAIRSLSLLLSNSGKAAIQTGPAVAQSSGT